MAASPAVQAGLGSILAGTCPGAAGRAGPGTVEAAPGGPQEHLKGLDPGGPAAGNYRAGPGPLGLA